MRGSIVFALALAGLLAACENHVRRSTEQAPEQYLGAGMHAGRID